MSYSEIEKKPLALKDIRENWEMNSIMDIKIMENECPSDYERLIDRQWPGSYHGCYDPTKEKKDAFTKNKKCGLNEQEVPKTGFEEIKSFYD